MAFWNKSEDPWDREPGTHSVNYSESPLDRDGEEEGLLNVIRDWAKEKKASERDRLVLPPELCPWCGGEMEQGYLTGGRGVFWNRGVPDTKSKWLGAGAGNVLQVDDDGVFFTYKTAWHCPSCEKMVFSSAGLTSPHGEPLQTEDQEDANGVLEEK